MEALLLVWRLFRVWREIGAYVVLAETIITLAPKLAQGLVVVAPPSPDLWRTLLRRAVEVQLDMVLWPRVVRRILDRMDGDGDGGGTPLRAFTGVAHYCAAWYWDAWGRERQA